MGGLALALVLVGWWGWGRDRSAREPPPVRPAAALPLGVTWLGQQRVDLGAFDVALYEPAQQRTVSVQFQVLADTTLSDADSLARLMRGHGRAIREQVDTVIRSATREELRRGDPSLFGRKMAARVNRELGRPVLRSVEVCNWTVSDR